jgi:hypothetical protein
MAAIGRYKLSPSAVAFIGRVRLALMTSQVRPMLTSRTEAAMTQRPDDSDQPEIVRALLVARYTLVIHDGMKVTSEGESWKLDFTAQLATIDAALQSAGVDTTKPMIAPVKWARAD